jgi:hypothetical protein
MGRGRQKAKHTKVARDLKYYSPDTNYGALANELHTGTGAPSSSAPAQFVSSEPSDPAEMSKWAEYLDDDQNEDEESRTA